MPFNFTWKHIVIGFILCIIMSPYLLYRWIKDKLGGEDKKKEESKPRGGKVPRF